MGRLSGGFDRCAHKSHGGPLPTSPLQPQVPGTQRGLPAPPGVDTDSGSSRRARRAFQARDYAPHLEHAWAPGRVSSPTERRRTQAAVFYWGEARGLMPGGRGSQTPRHPGVIRPSSSAQWPPVAPQWGSGPQCRRPVGGQGPAGGFSVRVDPHGSDRDPQWGFRSQWGLPVGSDLSGGSQ